MTKPTPRTDAARINAVHAIGAVVTADFARQLERENAELREAMRSAIDEIGWFVSRKKNLAEDHGTGITWAETLDTDLDILRAALAKTEGK